jgi:hypothetical protein
MLEKRVSSTNGVGKIVYPNAEDLSRPLSFILHKNQIKKGSKILIEDLKL